MHGSSVLYAGPPAIQLLVMAHELLRAWGGMLQVLVNAGQANAATGSQGAEDCTTSAEALSQALSIPVDQVHALDALCK